MNRKKSPQSKTDTSPSISEKRGSALTLAVLAVVILLVMGTGLLSLGQNSRIFAIRDASGISARCAADAGLTKAVFEMNEKLKSDKLIKGDWDANPATLPKASDLILPGCDATFSYTITRDINSVYTIESTGKFSAAQRTVYGLLRLRGAGEYGVLMQDHVILKSGTLVDGRDSRYPPDKQPYVELQMGTTSTGKDKVVLNNGVIINGDVLVGFGGDPNTVIKDLGAKITGYKGSLDEEPYLPPVTAPSGLPDMGKIDVKSKTVQIGPSGSGRYTHISLKQGKKHSKQSGILEIVGGKVVLHITGDIDMGQGCEIRIAEGASLELYVNGDIKSREDSGFNNQGTPPDLKLWGLAQDPYKHKQDFQLNAKSEYFGQLYAPNAKVTVMAKGDLYGAFTAYSFEMKSGGNLFYDGALRNVNPNDEGAHFVMKHWWE